MSCSGEHTANRAIRVLMAVAVAFATLGAAPAAAHDAEPVAPELEPFDPNTMVFPLISDREPMSDSFLAPRSHGPHYAIDLMRPEGVEVVAAADGVVLGWGYPDSQSECCFLFIENGDHILGYLHLLNDTVLNDPESDDNSGWGIAPGIGPGTVVRKGQLLGWVGDSGNASPYYPHLHFEIRYYGNGFEERINPYPYLLTAPILSEPGGAPVLEPDPEPEPFIGTSFTDDDGSPHEADIERLVELGVTRGCSETTYCPQESITRGQIAAFIHRYLGLEEGVQSTSPFIDTDDHAFENEIAAITEAGIGFGCGEFDYCPDAPLTREEMARFLVGTFDIALLGSPSDVFDDIDTNPYAKYIEAIEAVGVTLGCTDTSYCPSDLVTREQMASFFVRGHDLP